MAGMKLCKDCKHLATQTKDSPIHPDGSYTVYVCKRALELDLVTGALMIAPASKAHYQREREGVVGVCGRRGRWFEAKDNNNS